MASKGFSKGDPDAAESAAYEGLMNAARTYNENNDKGYSEEKFAKQGMAQAIRNLNRKKMDRAQTGNEDEDGYDAMQQVADNHGNEDTLVKQEQKEHLDRVLKDLPDHERWMFKHFTLGEDEDGNVVTQKELTAMFNSQFGHLNRSGKDVTREAILARNKKISEGLRQSLPKDSDDYSLMKFLIDRYVRMQKAEYLKDRYAQKGTLA
jgi:hypothetical protein